MRKFAVIVAGGSGTRMGGPLAKQYLPIGGKPILMHTLQRFADALPDAELVLVIPEADFRLWTEMVSECRFSVRHRLVAGGRTRFQSVKNGLDAIEGDEGLVAIHDGVRPFVSKEVILNSFSTAEETGSAIAVMPLKDSIRKITADGKSVFQERRVFRLVQTPQTFQVRMIKQAFMSEEMDHFTDDATVFEHQGWELSLIAGNPENIKITTPEDMIFADFLVGRR